MANYRVVNVYLSVYVPDEIAGDTALVEQYLNEKLHTDPDFYGEIDYGCFVVADETMSDGSDDE